MNNNITIMIMILLIIVVVVVFVVNNYPVKSPHTSFEAVAVEVVVGAVVRLEPGGGGNNNPPPPLPLLLDPLELPVLFFDDVYYHWNECCLIHTIE